MALTVLDAGVVIAVLDVSDRHHKAALEQIGKHRSDTLVVPVSAYAEILVGPFKRGPESAAIVDQFLERLPATVVLADREIARRAAELRAIQGSKLRLPDALVVSTALSLKAQHLMTTDAGWPDLPIDVIIIQG